MRSRILDGRIVMRGKMLKLPKLASAVGIALCALLFIASRASADTPAPAASNEPAQSPAEMPLPALALPLPEPVPPPEAPASPLALPAGGAAPQEAPLPEEAGIAENIHAGLSTSVFAAATWLDSFFYDPRYAAEENKTRMVIQSEAFDEEHSHLQYRTRLQFRIVLPQIQHKLRIIIAGDPDQQTEEQAQAGVNVPTRPEASKDRRATSALGYLFRSSERENINTQVGIRYRHGQVVVFFRPHYRVLYQLDSWALRFTQEFPWWTDTKWESVSAVELERWFANGFFFRSSLIGHWYENIHGYFYSVVFSVVQPLDAKHALHYDLINSFQTRPGDKLQEVLVDARYRRQLWKDWIFGEIAPQVRFPRSRDFEAVPGILFRVEMFFGKYN